MVDYIYRIRFYEILHLQLFVAQWVEDSLFNKGKPEAHAILLNKLVSWTDR